MRTTPRPETAGAATRPAETPPQRARGHDGRALGRHAGDLVHRVVNRHAFDVRRIVGHHHPELALEHQPNRVRAKLCRQRTVKVRGRAAALEMSEDNHPRLSFQAFMQLARDHMSDAAQAHLTDHAAVGCGHAPAMPACKAIHRVWRPMTSSTMIRS